MSLFEILNIQRRNSVSHGRPNPNLNVSSGTTADSVAIQPDLSNANTFAVHRSGHTKRKVTKTVFTWTVENFRFWYNEANDVKTDLKSPIFSIGIKKESKWCLQMKREYERHPTLGPLIPRQPIYAARRRLVYMYISLVSSNKPVHAMAKVELLSSNKIIQTIGPLRQDDFKTITEGSDYTKAPLNINNLFETELTIRCEIDEMDFVNTSGQSKIMQRKVTDTKLSKDLGNLLENGKFSDVTLVVCNLEVKAHKNILAARSDVFAAMFEHNMEESKLNRVLIEDIDYNVLNEMLKFVYTGRAPNIDKMAHELLVVANKYAMENLKEMCEDVLSAKLSVKTAAETLALADVYNAGQLKAHTVAYIKNHLTDVMQTQGWQDMIATRSYLMADVLHSFANQQIQT
ncbi:protein roadkill-like isoform 1-T1 [Glossina fuscipes fuscipes]